MKVNIIFFGRLAELAGRSNLDMENVSSTDELVYQLQQTYPAFKQAVYLVAVDKNIVQENTSLSNNMTIALLPPYSGG